MMASLQITFMMMTTGCLMCAEEWIAVDMSKSISMSLLLCSLYDAAVAVVYYSVHANSICLISPRSRLQDIDITIHPDVKRDPLSKRHAVLPYVKLSSGRSVDVSDIPG